MASSGSTFHRPEKKDLSRSPPQWHPWNPQRTVQTKPAQVEKGVTKILGWFLSNIWLWLEFSSWVISTLFRPCFILHSTLPTLGRAQGILTRLCGTPSKQGTEWGRKKPFPVLRVSIPSVCEWVDCSKDSQPPDRHSGECGLVHQGHSQFSQPPFRQHLPSFHDFQVVSVDQWCPCRYK